MTFAERVRARSGKIADHACEKAVQKNCEIPIPHNSHVFSTDVTDSDPLRHRASATGRVYPFRPARESASTGRCRPHQGGEAHGFLYL